MGACSNKIAPSSLPRANGVVLNASLDRLLRESGAYETRHLGQTALATHLKGTMHLLRIAGFQEAVCLGGLLHSIYGTSRFRTRSLSNAHERPKVVECAGVEAERLAFLFSTVNRPHSFRTLETKLAEECDAKHTFAYMASTPTSNLVALTLRKDLDLTLLEVYRLSSSHLPNDSSSVQPNLSKSDTSTPLARILVDENTALHLVAIEAANLLDQGDRYLLIAEDPNVYVPNHPLPLAINRIRTAAGLQGLALPPIRQQP